MDAAELKVRITADVNNAVAGMQKMQATNKQTADSFETVRAKMLVAKAAMEQATDPSKVIAYNQRIQELTVQMKQLSTMGMDPVSKGSVMLDNALRRATDGSSIAAREVNNLSRRLLYMGSAAVFGLAVEGVSLLVAALKDLSAEAILADKNLANLTEIQREAAKESGKEISDLQILYKAATDVTLSARQRYDAAKALQELWPQTFGNMTVEQIELGKLKGKYDDLTASIKANALAKAGQKKLEDLGGQVIDLEFEKDRALKFAKDATANLKSHSGIVGGFLGAGGVSESVSEQAINIENDKVRKLSEIDGKIRGLLTQQDYISGIIGKASLANAVEGGDKKEFERAEADLKEHLNKELIAVAGNREAIKAIKEKYDKLDIELRKQYNQPTTKTELNLANLENPLGNKNAAFERANKEEDKRFADRLQFLHKIDGDAKLVLEHEDVEHLAKRIEIYKKFGKEYASLTEEYLKKVEAIEKGDRLAGISQISINHATDFNTSDKIDPIQGKANILSTLSPQIIASNKYFDDLAAKLKDSKTLIDGMTSSFETFFKTAANGGKDAFKGLIQSLKDLVIQLGFAIIKAAILDAISGGGAGLKAAKKVSEYITGGGNMFFHADGGVFTRPTVLGNHVFGEAGPEAIVPLNKFPQFQSSGGDSQPIHVTVSGGLVGRGSDLLYVIDKATARRGRNG